MSWIQDKEANLALQGLNLATQVGENVTALGLTQTEADNLADKAAEFNAALQAKLAAQQAYREAVTAANASEGALKLTMTSLNRKVQANQMVSDELKLKVGFPVYVRPAQSTPKTPTFLSASVSGQNEIALRWRRNGNATSAVFIVQQRLGNGPWTTIAVTPNLRHRFQTPTPGQPVDFQVIAQVRGLTSAPSAGASLWQTGGAGDVTLEVAA